MAGRHHFFFWESRGPFRQVRRFPGFPHTRSLGGSWHPPWGQACPPFGEQGSPQPPEPWRCQLCGNCCCPGQGGREEAWEGGVPAPIPVSGLGGWGPRGPQQPCPLAHANRPLWACLLACLREAWSGCLPLPAAAWVGWGHISCAQGAPRLPGTAFSGSRHVAALARARLH